MYIVMECTRETEREREWEGERRGWREREGRATEVCWRPCKPLCL